MPGAIAEHPLTHGLMRKYFVHQQGGAVGHSAHPAAGAADLLQLRAGPQAKHGT
jgi:hypothetical protein